MSGSASDYINYPNGGQVATLEFTSRSLKLVGLPAQQGDSGGEGDVEVSTIFEW